jgi:SAM-dependent methyltransferase
LLNRYLPKREGWSVLEVGACPGTQLLAIALSHGYHPVALDYLPAVRQMPEAFARFGVPDLEVIETDFLTFETARRFDVVTSYGFVEHFAEPEEVIRRQWDLVADGGYLVIGSPAFGPLQLALRRLILRPESLRSTLRTHNLRIMGAEAIARVLRRCPGAEIVCASYAGAMGTWFTPRDKDVRRGRAWVLAAWYVLGRVPRWLNWSSPRFSPLCLVIARKSGSAPPGPRSV